MNIIEQILEKVPQDAMISSHSYEGANIVLYTKNKSFFLHGGDIIRQLVDDFKKRIELRADSNIMLSPEDTKKFIEKTIPKDAEITQIVLQPARSLVIIEAKKPGIAIGKDGEYLREIKNETLWTPSVKRESVIPSKITTLIRSVLYENSEERRKFLDKTGKRIYETKRATTDEMWARVTFLGGARQVGRSCLLLQTPESRVLLDCGVNVADERRPFPYLSSPEFNIQDLDAVIITHAHLDHSGLLPYLFKFGYKGPVYCTAPTRDIMAMLTLDYISVSHAQGKESIYSSQDIKQMVKNTITLEYGEVTDITPDVRLTLYDAGHILGSAMAHIHLGEGWHNFVYTGDFKTIKTQLLNPANSKFPRVETVLMESTYGSHEAVVEDRPKAEKRFGDLVKTTLKDGGKVLIPVLGVGRAQDVMVTLEKYFTKEKLNYPIYIDGMVWDVTAVHNMYPRFLNSDIRQQIFYEGKDPFLNPIFKRVGSKKERDKVFEGGPCVVLATSGMLVGGPSVEYLKNLADDAKNSLIFVAYQGVGSLGRRIQSGDREITFEGETAPTKIKIGVTTIDGFTGHSDWNELISYVGKIKPKPKKIILMHGESARTLELASTLHKTYKLETTSPKNLDVIRLK